MCRQSNRPRRSRLSIQFRRLIELVRTIFIELWTRSQSVSPQGTLDTSPNGPASGSSRSAHSPSSCIANATLPTIGPSTLSLHSQPPSPLYVSFCPAVSISCEWILLLTITYIVELLCRRHWHWPRLRLPRTQSHSGSRSCNHPRNILVSICRLGPHRAANHHQSWSAVGTLLVPHFSCSHIQLGHIRDLPLRCIHRSWPVSFRSHLTLLQSY